LENNLFYGDNLEVLRKHVADESVDLVYLDRPFNSNANYGISFRAADGKGSDAQIEAFEDSWHWNDSAEDAFDQVAQSGNTKAFDLLNAMRAFLGENDMMAYIAMMAVRLIELPSSRAETRRKSLSPLRPDREPLPQATVGWGFRRAALSQRDRLEATERA
jgi:hypothetical protein